MSDFFFFAIYLVLLIYYLLGANFASKAMPNSDKTGGKGRCLAGYSTKLSRTCLIINAGIGCGVFCGCNKHEPEAEMQRKEAEPSTSVPGNSCQLQVSIWHFSPALLPGQAKMIGIS